MLSCQAARSSGSRRPAGFLHGWFLVYGGDNKWKQYHPSERKESMGAGKK
jgi:hypothetical protein